jgi:prevent-host-death family protein
MYRKEDMMKEVNVTELRNNLPAYLGMVKDGEELLLTSRGKKIARLTPVADGLAEVKEKLARLRGKCTIGDVVSSLNEKWEAAS